MWAMDTIHPTLLNPTSQHHGLLESLSSGRHFFSLIMDVTTDAGKQENELIVIVNHFRDEVMQEIIHHTRYLSIRSPKNAGACGLIKYSGKALKVIGIGNVLDKDRLLGVESKPVLVGVGTDGAKLNVTNRMTTDDCCNKFSSGYASIFLTI